MWFDAGIPAAVPSCSAAPPSTSRRRRAQRTRAHARVVLGVVRAVEALHGTSLARASATEMASRLEKLDRFQRGDAVRNGTSVDLQCDPCVRSCPQPEQEQSPDHPFSTCSTQRYDRSELLLFAQAAEKTKNENALVPPLPLFVTQPASSLSGATCQFARKKNNHVMDKVILKWTQGDDAMLLSTMFHVWKDGIARQTLIQAEAKALAAKQRLKRIHDNKMTWTLVKFEQSNDDFLKQVAWKAWLDVVEETKLAQTHVSLVSATCPTTGEKFQDFNPYGDSLASRDSALKSEQTAQDSAPVESSTSTAAAVKAAGIDRTNLIKMF